MAIADGNGHDDGPPLDWHEADDFWARCRLRTFLTDPPVHELTLPSGQVLRLKTSDFFDVRRFTLVFIDATGDFPALPEKKPGVFLREAFRGWLHSRSTAHVPAEEASDRGALLGDIRRAISSCPQTEDPRDLDRGAIYTREDGAIWVSARILLERVRRACPAKFAPAEFYLALSALGATNLEVQRDAGWRGRVWSLPTSLLPEPTLLPGTSKETVTELGPPDEPLDFGL